MARWKVKSRDVLSLFNLINCRMIAFNWLDLSFIVREYVYSKKGDLSMKQKILERVKAEVNASKIYTENWVKKAKKEKLDQPLTF